ncbi:protein CCSMST1 isoform X2 [Morone saxatilis]|uniref:protein CCSMST1 isoform X2 n=1 Tax=Morone saxatilis TaxID=34816 RepID=UPI0015E236F6|nr:protein CCSMST1 isoform X2 [Morone saxatilis]
MSTTAGRVFAGVRRRGVFIHSAASTVRLNGVRFLAVSLQRTAKSTDDDQEVKNEPIKFSTSKASYRTWKVDRSLGSKYKRPWWRVLPISLLTISFLLWCALREETDIDAQLDKKLYEQLPSLLSDEEEEQDKSS